MEQIIQTLLDIDMSGQQLVEQAQQIRQTEQARMDKYKKEMYDRYVAEQQERIEKYKSFSAQDCERQMKELQEEYDAKLARLEEKYAENEQRWTGRILNLCIGR